MIFIYLLCILHIFAQSYPENIVPPGILKNDKFYLFSPATIESSIPKMIIYTLKDGPVNEIRNTILNITDAPSGYIPQLLNLNGDLENGVSNQIWMLEGYLSSTLATTEFDNSKWMAQFVDDKQLNYGSGFIKPPNFTYFPKGGYTQNFVNIDNNPALYIVGGFIFSKETNSRLLTSCVFKYDFITKSWSDLSEGSKSILPPITSHRTVQVDNSLFVFNGAIPNTNDTNYPQTSAKIVDSKFNTINKTFKFDLLTGKWVRVPLKVNLDAKIYREDTMHGASYDYYEGNIITYSLIFNDRLQSREPYFGTLDLNSLEWNWNQIKAESGLDNTLLLSFHQTLVIRDQLILFLGYTNQKSNLGPYVINLKYLTFKSSLDYSEKSNDSDGSTLKINIIIGLGSVFCCILLIALIIFYIRYRKMKSDYKDNKQETKALWAAPIDGKQRYISEGKNVNVDQKNDSQKNNIFCLESNDNIEFDTVSSFAPDGTNGLTLVSKDLELTNLTKSYAKFSK